MRKYGIQNYLNWCVLSTPIVLKKLSTDEFQYLVFYYNFLENCVDLFFTKSKFLIIS